MDGRSAGVRGGHLGSDALLQRIVTKPDLSGLRTGQVVRCAQTAQMRLGYDALKRGVAPHRVTSNF